MKTVEGPLVSVIVPNYNHADYLEERLRSIQSQTYKNLEIILLDDASNDNSIEILNKFAHSESRVKKCIFNTVNSGQVNSQWLTGINSANGDFIWIAESDDSSSSDFLGTLLSELQQSAECGLIYCDSNVINERGTILRRYDFSSPKYKSIWNNDFSMNGREFISNFLIHRNVIPNVSGVLFRADLLRDKINQNKLRYCADWFLYINILLSSNVKYLNKPLNYFRKHDFTTRNHNISTYRRELKEKIYILRYLLNIFDDTETGNIKRSLSFFFSNRHKYRRISRAISSIRQHKQIACRIILYGVNDISECLTKDLVNLASRIFIVDTYKCDGELSGVSVRNIQHFDFKSDDYVVLCTLSHHAEMRNTLDSIGFNGTIINV
ncbi:glycosyltransferase [Alteromonas ponticola]|uniref:Glycosyltransferase n=1 Tax=Alteromonas aquimaris TaxID=2998417 RepID=A0ABT3P6A5_9ALTE|nr:glycosyltransferase [Alteromonas aquimaris]MCW8107611.1 glycosyltransferase [Alteromonas aquimaris]